MARVGPGGGVPGVPLGLGNVSFPRDLSSLSSRCVAGGLHPPAAALPSASCPLCGALCARRLPPCRLPCAFLGPFSRYVLLLV